MEKMQKTKEQLLFERSTRIYNSIASSSGDGFIVVDMKGSFIDANEVYCELMGYEMKELLKMALSDVMVVEKQNEIEKYLQQVKKKNKGRLLTQYRKKDGVIVDVEVSSNYGYYLDGVVFVFIRDITKRNKVEADLAKHHAKSKKIIEGQLTDSYKHLGMINRKISLLLELGRYPKSLKDKQKIMDHVLNLAMSISKAPTGYLYGSKGEKEFMLLSSMGLLDKQKEKIKLITAETVGLLKYLLKEKKLTSGDIKQYEADLLAIDKKLEYFVTLPLEAGMGLGGFIFLGFNKKTNVDVQDLEFLDVFAMHASRALNKAGVLE